MRISGNLVLILLSCAFAPTLLASDPVIDAIHDRQEQILKNLHDVTYKGTSVSREYDSKKTLKRETVIKRSVWLKGNFFEKSVVDSVSINGKPVSPAESQKQMGGGMRNRMPFQPTNWNAYVYTSKGQKTWNGMMCDVVDFDPIKKEMGYLKGEAYTYQGDIVYMQFNPAHPVMVMKQSSFSMKYAQTGGYWLPSRFEMAIEIEVKAIVSFAHIFVDVAEDYSDYILNTGIEDSFFSKKR